MQVPNDVQSVSPGECEIEYPLYYRTRMLSRHGYMKLDRQAIDISSALAGVTVGITDLDELHFSVYFDCIEFLQNALN